MCGFFRITRKWSEKCLYSGFLLQEEHSQLALEMGSLMLEMRRCESPTEGTECLLQL